MGTTNFGTQSRFVAYKSSVDSSNVNDRVLNTLPRGIYSGCYLTKVSDTSVSISAGEFEIGDVSHQVRIQTTAAQAITVGTGTPYLVLRWAYAASTTNYMDMLVVSAPSTNDLTIGKCIFSGSTLTGFSYSERSNPAVLSKYLLVEPTETTSMYVRIRTGQISNGSATIDVVDQISPLFSTAGLTAGQSRIDVIVTSTTGVISVIAGTAATTGSQLAPDYSSNLALAEVTIAYGTTTIVSTNIRNVANAQPTGIAYKTYVDARTTRTVVFTQAYTLSAGSIPFQIRFPLAGTITGVYGYVSSAPTGASLICDVNVASTSIWNNGANRLTFTASSTTASQTTINNAAITAGQLVTVDIDQVGSIVAGDNLTININVTV